MQMPKLAVMLLAGRGSRLEELTNNLPKCLISVNEKPILHRMLNNLAAVGIKKVVLVIGYLGDMIREYVGLSWKGMSIEYIENPYWSTTNNVVSLYYARKKIDQNFLLLEGDIVTSVHAIKKMMGINRIALDQFENFMDGTVVSVDETKRVKHIYLKCDQNRPEKLSNFYKTVNIYSFDFRVFQEKVLMYLKKLIASNKLNVYYEQAFAAAIDDGVLSLSAINYHDESWAEIDDQKDLHYAEKIFAFID